MPREQVVANIREQHVRRLLCEGESHLREHEQQYARLPLHSAEAGLQLVNVVHGADRLRDRQVQLVRHRQVLPQLRGRLDARPRV